MDIEIKVLLKIKVLVNTISRYFHITQHPTSCCVNHALTNHSNSNFQEKYF